ncbi:structural maintenance of chromosomes protein 4-like [Pseudophryne corroboree]|uniref:structural maintenance of chromosomes protein 4-like n=1 Tax=Pseudophryne corroboree TaxID=495146 RepID=UPI0030818DBC
MYLSCVWTSLEDLSVTLEEKKRTGGDVALRKAVWIKKSTPSEKTETVELNVQTTITVTDTDGQEVQEKRRDSVAQNNTQDVNNEEEDEEDVNAEEKGEQENADEEKDIQEAQNKEAGPKENNTQDTNEITALLVNKTPIPVIATKSGPTPRRVPKFKQRASRQFKSKPPKRGVLGFGDDIPGMEGLGTDITVICPWEAFSHLELHELSQYGII